MRALLTERGPLKKAELARAVQDVGHSRAASYRAIRQLAERGLVELGFDGRYRTQEVTP